MVEEQEKANQRCLTILTGRRLLYCTLGSTAETKQADQTSLTNSENVGFTCRILKQTIFFFFVILCILLTSSISGFLVFLPLAVSAAIFSFFVQNLKFAVDPLAHKSLRYAASELNNKSLTLYGKQGSIYTYIVWVLLWALFFGLGIRDVSRCRRIGKLKVLTRFQKPGCQTSISLI